MPRLLLLRHGRTAWNAERRFQGQTDIPLDDVGLSQAQVAGADIARARPAAVWSSDSMRARVTAEAIGMPVHTDPRLREIALGTYEGLTPGEWAAIDPAQHELWHKGFDVRRGGGETYLEVGVRAAAAVREACEALAPDDLLVVVTHGGTVRSLLSELLALPGSPWAHLGALDNCCGALLSDPGDFRGWRLLRYGLGPAALLGL